MNDDEFVPTRRVSDVMTEHGVSLRQLIWETGLEERVAQAIVHQQYTPSPEQRREIARALDVEQEQIWWGHEAPVEPIKEPV